MKKVFNFFTNIYSFLDSHKTLIKIIELFIFALTLFYAIQIGNRQNEINQSLLDLNYLPSISISTYNELGQLKIENKGHSNFWFWGIRYGKDSFMEYEPKLIPQQGNYDFSIEKLGKKIKTELKGNGQSKQVLYVFIKTSNNKPYVVKTIYDIDFRYGTYDTELQVVGIFQSEFDNFLQRENDN